MSSATQGRDEVLGVLIDMAEVWELYVYNLLRSAITGAEVLHTGRARDAEDYLLRSVKTGIAPLGRLKPDVVIRSFSSSQPLSVLDAKYKSTVPSAEKPFGVVREDLYQLNAYLSAFGGRDAPVIGGLVYPAEPSSAVIHLQEANAWYTTRAGAPFYFFGIDGSPPTEVAQPLTPGEAAFVASIQTLMRQAT
jgi:5-methylcytosine-specific restriction enzyme subunit McrC